VAGDAVCFSFSLPAEMNVVSYAAMDAPLPEWIKS